MMGIPDILDMEKIIIMSKSSCIPSHRRVTLQSIFMGEILIYLVTSKSIWKRLRVFVLK